MATLISGNGDGNFATAATWKNLAAGTGTIQTQTAYGGGVSSTVYAGVGWSVAMTITSGEVIEGVGLYLLSNGTTGTVTVALSDDGGTTATREVTVNSSDLPRFTSWVFFKFGSTLTADGGSDYKVSVKNSSSGSTVSLSRSSTTYDFARFVRVSSAPGSLSAGDVFYIVDDWTAAATVTTNTVTMNETATTDYGEINVGFGTLTFGTSASTNYYLKASGNVTVWGGGTLNIGTTGTPMPSTSTAVLEIDPTSDGEFGLKINDGATLSVQGASMTRVWDLLNANASANATSLTTANSTGWKDNDQIAIASTTRTAAETELGALNGDASGTTLTVDGFGGAGGGVAYAHAGSATGGAGSTDIRAEIVNLTRNVKIRSATSTLMAYVYIAATATVDIDYAEFYYLGENASTKRGIEVATTTGSCSIQYSSVHDCEDWGLYVSTASGSITSSNNVFYNLCSSTAANLNSIYVAATSGAHTMSYNCILGCKAPNSGTVVSFNDVGSVFTYNRIAGCSCGGGYTLYFSESGGVVGTFSDLTFHSNSALALFNNILYGTMSGSTFWRNNYGGIYLNGCQNLTFSDAKLFGNLTANIYGVTTLENYNVVFSNCAFDADSGYSVSYGLYSASHARRFNFVNCTFGTNFAHSTDIYGAGGVEIRLYNTTLASATEVGGMSSWAVTSYVRSHKNDGSATTYKNWYRFGTNNSNQTIRHTASGYSWNTTPSNATFKLVFPGPSTFDTYKVAVNASAAVTITAYVYKDSSYNGNAPRLVLVGGYIGGIASDVTDSLTVAHSNWEQLSVSGTPNEAGVVEFYLDCDGTAGSVYIDDISISQA